MELYSGKVRLGGNIMHEVRKKKITAAEVMILRAIHGTDAVVDLKRAGSDRRSHAAERERLTDTYASPKLASEQAKRRQQIMQTLFGHSSLPLPDRLEEPVGEPEEKPKRVKLKAEPAEEKQTEDILG